MTTLTQTLTRTDVRSRLISADVVFGSPSKKCAGTGICKVTTRSAALFDPELPCCNKAAADILYVKQDRLLFRIAKQGLCAKVINGQFAYGQFKIEEPLLLPGFILEAFDLPPAQLVSGTFPVQFFETFLEVELRYKQAEV